MWSRFSFSLGNLTFLLMVLGAGCNSRVATYSVSGTVRFEDGQPVPHGTIEFRNEKSGVSARGQLDDSGAYSLETFSADDGAPAGNYRAIVAQYFNASPSTARVSMDADHRVHNQDADVRVASEVGDFSTSPLRAEVRPDDKNHFDFVVRRYTPPRPSRPGPTREKL